MADPSTQTRGTPAGKAAHDGFSVTIALAGLLTGKFWEVTVKPPAFDGGDPVDHTSQHNTTYVTKVPQDLIELEDITFSCKLDWEVLEDIKTQINLNQACTIAFPDGSTITLFAWLRRFEPQEMARGTPVRANGTIVVSNWDPVNDVEAGPVISSVTGTP